jgi:hypothetical protein
MITLQRQLLIRVREEVTASGESPKHTKPNTYYPVIGYMTGPRANKEKTKEYEDIRFFYYVNERGYLERVFPSQCEIFVDWTRPEYAKEEALPNGKEKAGAGS